jgi:DNA-binding NarL/FixJ family response regulator
MFVRARFHITKMKVFIVDDSPAVVDRLADLLQEVPGVVLVGQAADVQEAVRGIRNLKPDALILDLQIPGGSGLDVLRAIRSDYPRLRVLICTNYPYPQYRQECLTAGANFFLDKSAEFSKIPAILRELIENESKTSPIAP